MAFDFRKGWKFWVFLGILVVAVIISILLFYLKTIPREGERFVDTIPKIIIEEHKDEIQQALNNNSYAPIIFEVDNPSSVDIVLGSLTKEEFQFQEISADSILVMGNASFSAITKLEKNKHVIRIAYSHMGRAFLQDSTSIINATSVWNIQINSINLTGENITVCVVDTGINYSHPDLGNCPRTSNINTANCSRVIGGYDYLSDPDDNDPMDEEDGHGTHVAGIIAAKGGILGVAPKVKLVVLRAFHDYTGAYEFKMRDSILWCINNRNNFTPPIKIISFSGGINPPLYTGSCDGKDEVVNAANSALSYGIIMVAATGNDGSKTSIVSPACGSNVTSVGYSGKDDHIATLSNRNNMTDLVAPGYLINSTNSTNGRYFERTGTSQATPHVSGAAALLLQLKPDLTPYQIKDLLNLTGKQIYDDGYSNRTYSRIDVYKAIMAVNASLLQITDLNEVYSEDNQRIFRFTIKNANLSNITNISWQADISDGQGKIKGNENITSLLFGESTVVLFMHNFSSAGVYNLTVTAWSGNLIYTRSILINISGTNIAITELSDVGTANQQKTFRFNIKNFGGSQTNNLSWSFDFGDSATVSSEIPFNLSSSGEIYTLLQHNYGVAGNYTVNATVYYNGIINTSLTKNISVPSINLEVSGLAVVNSSQNDRIFRFLIYNPLSSSLGNVNWTLDFGDGNSTSSTANVILPSGEYVYVLAEHNYISSGNFDVNATARNGTLIDSQTISIGI